MRVALVRPLSRSPTYDPEIQEPLGIELLAGVLRAAGHEVVLHDAMLFPRSEEEIAGAIGEFEPDVVGVSLMGETDLESAALLMDHIQSSSNSQVARVAGGSLVSTEPERVASSLPEGTFLIRFEGEGPILRLLESIENGESFESLPSLSWRQGQRWVSPSTYELVENLDGNPWPARDLAPVVARRFGVLNVQGSRGCTGSCTYCCMPSIPRLSGTSWRGRSPQDIARELEELRRQHDVVAFNFVDDDFLGPARGAEDRANALADAVAERGLRIGFGAQLRPHTLGPRTIEAMARAGLAWAFVGVESDEPATLRAWRRQPAKIDVWGSIELLRDQEVEVEAGIILFHPEAHLDTVRRLVDKLVERGLLNLRTATSRLHLLPGSHLYEQFKNEGALPAGVPGPFTPPIRDSRVDTLFLRLTQSLAPLRPCWVHAACQLPGLVSQCRAGRSVTPALGTVRGVLDDLNSWVCETIDTHLIQVDRGTSDTGWTERALETSREKALLACDRLERGGLISDPQQLREAIAVESRS